MNELLGKSEQIPPMYSAVKVNGKKLYEYVLQYAKEQGCYNVTLNVWACNESAKCFYEHCGFVPQKIGMEKILVY